MVARTGGTVPFARTCAGSGGIFDGVCVRAIAGICVRVGIGGGIVCELVRDGIGGGAAFSRFVPSAACASGSGVGSPPAGETRSSIESVVSMLWRPVCSVVIQTPSECAWQDTDPHASVQQKSPRSARVTVRNPCRK